MSKVTCSLHALGATPNDRGALFCRRESALAAETVEGIIRRLEEAIAYSHVIEGVQKYDISLTAVVGQHFV
jgi:hypothetical protein